MKFVVSSTELLGHLQAISRVISSKNTLPILDNFLFNLKGNDLEITASDLESTLITKMKLENAEGDGSVALSARILLDTLKEFPVQPLAFDINMDTMAIVISSENGKFRYTSSPRTWSTPCGWKGLSKFSNFLLFKLCYYLDGFFRLII